MKAPINAGTTIFLEHNVCNSKYFTPKFLQYTNDLRNELKKLLGAATVQLSIEWAWIPTAAGPDGEEIEVFIILDGEWLTQPDDKSKYRKAGRFEIFPYAVTDWIMDAYSPKILAESILKRIKEDAKYFPNS